MAYLNRNSFGGWLLVARAALLPLQVGGQQPILISDQPTCKTCAIVVGPKALTIGDPEHPTAGLGGSITELPGPLYLAGGDRRGGPAVFDKFGKFIGSLGQKGSGPGEFVSATAFASGPGDSVAIFDPVNRRLQVFDRAFRFVRGFIVSQQVINGGILWLPGKPSFVAGGLMATPSGIGFSVHLYSGDGGLIKSIGESKDPVVPNNALANGQRLLQDIGTGEVIAVTVAGSYRIEQWNLSTGALTKSWKREAPWFAVEAGPFRSRVLAARVDPTGLLWILLAVPSPDWKKGVRERLLEGMETTLEVIDRHLIMDGVVEVIDLRKGALVARLKTDRSYSALLRGGMLAAEAVDADSSRSFNLFSVSLTGK